MGNVTFREVCEIFERIEKTPSRNEMTDILATFYKTLNSNDSQIISYLILGRVVPFFVSSEFNYSEKSFLSLLSEIAKSKGLKENVFVKRKELGDIGDTLQYFSEKFQFNTKEVSLGEIYEALWKIIKTTGIGSIDVKNSVIMDTFSKISPLETKYFSRIVCGSLRFGLNAKTLLDVFSFVAQGNKGMREELDRAYGAYADIGYICSQVVADNPKVTAKNLKSVKIQPGIPVLPRLVERVSKFDEVFERMEVPILVQSKYDGLRCQIHKYKKTKLKTKTSVWLKYIEKEENHSLFSVVKHSYEVRLFTRNLEDVTEMFPEVVEEAMEMNGESFILDSEVLGWDSRREIFMTFQETMQRRRKYNVKGLRKDIPVKAMVFDILYLDGKNLSEKDTKERIKDLNSLKVGGSICVDETKEVGNIEDLYEVFNVAVKYGHEGVIVKESKGKYIPGVRNFEWIKLKKSMERKLVDSIDLVAVGYSLGSGRRRDLGMGAVLGAIYNEKENIFEAICNVGTGFSDEQLREIFNSFKEDVVGEKPRNVSVEKTLMPDVWVEPRVVFTVEADEITKKKGSKKLSLRFPRLIEWGRDKGVTEATSVKELEGMYDSLRNIDNI